jgi:CHAD domain-containing protein
MALKLSFELATPLHLNRTNLHPYRLKVKELRNVLQMAERKNDDPFVDDLGEVKDAIGAWHDWEELVSIASDVLDHGPKCQLIREMKAIAETKYEQALKVAEKLRGKYLRVQRGKKSRSADRGTSLAPSAQSATAAMAA